MNRLAKLLVVALVVSPILVFGGLAQQNVTIRFNEYLFLDCSDSPDIDYTLTQADFEKPQPFEIGTWHCNVDALSQYRLNSTMATTWQAYGADIRDFYEVCNLADGDGGAACAPGTSLSPLETEEATRRGTGGNTAGTDGGDFRGTISVDISGWDIPMNSVGPAGLIYQGVITYVVTDLTP